MCGRARRSSPRAPRARRSPGAQASGVVAACVGRLIEAGARARVAGGTGRPGPQEDGVARRSRAPSRATARVWPLVSPLRHSVPREREWKCASPVRRVASTASASCQATISTRPSSASWTTLATRPSGTVPDGVGVEGSAGRSEPSGTRLRETDGDPGRGHVRLDRGDGVDVAVEDRGGQDGVRMPLHDRGRHVGR